MNGVLGLRGIVVLRGLISQIKAAVIVSDALARAAAASREPRARTFHDRGSGSGSVSNRSFAGKT
jgi:hypothetical protein